MIEWVVDQPGIRLGLGDSVEYDGDADLVFSHLYGPLPPQLVGKPAIINVYGNKREAAERWCGASLHEMGKWGRGLTNTIYSANLPERATPIWELVEEEFAPGRGWFPLALPMTVFETLRLYTHDVLRPGITVFDGFMGRGTVGKACQELGFGFVGIDRDPDRVALAAEYLGISLGEATAPVEEAPARGRRRRREEPRV
jgi:hypothetical protein